MICLWTENNGWQHFELSDTAELERRVIVIGAGAFIGDRASIGAGVRIGAIARIGNEAFIGVGARIGNWATIGDGVTPVVIYINGSRYPVSYWGEDRIDIGCTSRRIHEWLNDSEAIAREYNFTPEQTAEYRGYVEFIATIHKRQAGTPEKDAQ